MMFEQLLAGNYQKTLWEQDGVDNQRDWEKRLFQFKADINSKSERVLNWKVLTHRENKLYFLVNSAMSHWEFLYAGTKILWFYVW